MAYRPAGPAAALVRASEVPNEVARWRCSPLPLYRAVSIYLPPPGCIIYFGCAARHADGCQPWTHVPTDDGAPYWMGPKGNLGFFWSPPTNPLPPSIHNLTFTIYSLANWRDLTPSNSTGPEISDISTRAHAPMHAGTATGCARSPLSLIGASCTGVPGSRVRGRTPDKTFTFLDLLPPMPELSI